MANGFSPIGLANTGIPGAPAPAAPGGSPLDFLKNTDLGLALLQSGLSTLGGTNPGQAMSQGVGLYSQLAGQKARTAQQDLENKMAERQIGLKEEELEFRKEDAEERRRLEREKIEAAKAANATKAPKGVNDKLWKQALDMAKASAGVDQFGNPLPVEPSSVYRYYRTLDPETTVNMPFGTGELGAILQAVSKQPENADLIFGAASDLYGEAPMKRLRKRWEALNAEATAAMPPEPEPTQEPTTAPATTTTTPATSTYQPSPYWGGVKQPQVPTYGNWGLIMGQ